MSLGKREVLRLYRDLLRYSNTLTHTEPEYFRARVVAEFRRNRDLTDDDKISFAYRMVWVLSSLRRSSLRLPTLASAALKHTVDYSRLPQLKDYELEEKFVRGSGPGGSAVNKNSNCVVLTHKPSGIVIKCHTSRCLDDNRKTAREMLILKLDAIQNEDQSVTAQKDRIQEKKFKSSEYKRKKMQRLKSEWMEREGMK